MESGGLVIDVSDPVLVFPEVREEPGSEGEGGRGLLVVSRVAAELEWFLRAPGAGKTVRARLLPHRPLKT